MYSTSHITCVQWNKRIDKVDGQVLIEKVGISVRRWQREVGCLLMYSTSHITCVQWNKRRHRMPDVDRACHGSQKRWAMALQEVTKRKLKVALLL